MIGSCVRIFDTLCFPSLLQWNELLWKILEAVNILWQMTRVAIWGRHCCSLSSINSPPFFPTEHQFCLLQRTILLSQSARDFFLAATLLKPWGEHPEDEAHAEDPKWRHGKSWHLMLLLNHYPFVSESQPALDSPVLWDRKVPFVKAS